MLVSSPLIPSKQHGSGTACLPRVQEMSASQHSYPVLCWPSYLAPPHVWCQHIFPADLSPYFYVFWIHEAQRHGIRPRHPPLSFFIPLLCHPAPAPRSSSLDMLRFLLSLSSPLLFSSPPLIYPFTVLPLFHPGCFSLLRPQNFTAHSL